MDICSAAAGTILPPARQPPPGALLMDPQGSVPTTPTSNRRAATTTCDVAPDVRKLRIGSLVRVMCKNATPGIGSGQKVRDRQLQGLRTGQSPRAAEIRGQMRLFSAAHQQSERCLGCSVMEQADNRVFTRSSEEGAAHYYEDYWQISVPLKCCFTELFTVRTALVLSFVADASSVLEPSILWVTLLYSPNVA